MLDGPSVEINRPKAEGSIRNVLAISVLVDRCGSAAYSCIKWHLGFSTGREVKS